MCESKERAIFWHSLWKCNGSPRHGTLAEIRRKTRTQYHRALKHLKASNGRAKADKLATALTNNDNVTFWQNVQRLRGSKQTLPNVVDGVLGPEAISSKFAQKYKELYNSVSFNKRDMELLSDDLAQSIKIQCCSDKCESAHCITTKDVKLAIGQLKHGKSDGSYQSSDLFINGTPKLHVYLSLLLTSMLRHGQCSEGLLLSTLIPIPKNRRKSLNDSDNYRAIALGSIVGENTRFSSASE